nr:glycosyltransferase family 25 protein [uncultured Rhodopila sp.]
MSECIRVINLDRSPDRFARFIERHPGVPIERFSAVDGFKIDRDTCVINGLITNINEYTPGAFGNMMSHLALWRECSEGSEPYHIVEDDATLRHDFLSVTSALLDTLDGWDVVLWAHNFDWPLQIRPAQGLGVAVVQYDDEAMDAVAIKSFLQDCVKPMLLPLFSAAGVCCYSISPRGAVRMLSDCLPIGREPASYLEKRRTAWMNTAIDVEMSRHYGDWRAYVALPPMAITDNDQNVSTVQGRSAAHLAALHHAVIT